MSIQSLITSILECTFEHMHDFSADRGSRSANCFIAPRDFNGNRSRVIEQFVTVLRGAIGTPQRA